MSDSSDLTLNFQQATDGSQQIIGLHGFHHDIKTKTLIGSVLDKASGGTSGKENHMSPGRKLHYPPRGLNAVDTGHDDVTDQQIGMILLGALECAPSDSAPPSAPPIPIRKNLLCCSGRKRNAFIYRCQ
jgi:hypothetical protein